MSESSFARGQLLKHGWTDGCGLGREGTGIKEAIKVHVKNNKTGIGHDPSVDFLHHWWHDVFNKTASSIQVETTEDGTVQVKRDEKKMKATSREAVRMKAKSKLYGSFIKGATLKQADGQHLEEKEGSSSSSEEDMCSQTRPLDLELFEECDGRTAHKGARHGLGLNGKLQRIQAMEQLFLQQVKTNKSTSESDKETDNVSRLSPQNEKKETSECCDSIDPQHSGRKKRSRELLLTDNEPQHSGRKKRRGKELLLTDNDPQHSGRKKRRGKELLLTDNDPQHSGRKKRSKELPLTDNEPQHSGRKRKEKKVTSVNDNTLDDDDMKGGKVLGYDNDTEVCGDEKKKKKRKKKKVEIHD